MSRGKIRNNGGVYNPGAVLLGSSIVMLCRREIDYRFTDVVFPEIVTVDPDTLEVCRPSHVEAHTATLRVAHRGFPAASISTACCSPCIRSCGAKRVKPVISRVAGPPELYDNFELPFETGPVEKNWVLFVRNGSAALPLQPRSAGHRRARRRRPLEAGRRLGERLGRRISIQMLGNFREPDTVHGRLPRLLAYAYVEGRYVQGAFLLDRDLTLRARTGTLLDGADVVDGYDPGVLLRDALVGRAGHVLAFFGEGDTHTGVAIFDSQELGARSSRPRSNARRTCACATKAGPWATCRTMRLLQCARVGTDFPPVRLPRRRSPGRRGRAPRSGAQCHRPQASASPPGACDYVLSGPTGRLLARGASEHA